MTSVAIRLLNLKHRVQSRGRGRTPRVFVNSIPKTGTNLVVSLALAYRRIMLSGPIIAKSAGAAAFRSRPGLIFGHVENLEGTVTTLDLDGGFLLIRRPDGYVMSLARYIEANRRHPAHHAFAGKDPARLFDAIIGGARLDGFDLPGIDARYRQYIVTAEKAGLGLVDFDALKACPQGEGPAADLMRVIGGDDYAARFGEMLALSKLTSTTYRHSGRSSIAGDLPDDCKHHPAFEEAVRLYDRAISR